MRSLYSAASPILLLLLSTTGFAQVRTGVGVPFTEGSRLSGVNESRATGLPRAPLAAQTPQGQRAPLVVDDSNGPFKRGWIDVNLGLSFAAEKSYQSKAVRTLFLEPATSSVDYSLPRGADFDYGGGVLLARQFGLGISFAGAVHQGPPLIALSIPHPNFSNDFGTDSKVGDTELRRTESAIHIQGMLVPVDSGSVRVRIFGGPSYMRAKQDTVDVINYTQSASLLSRANVINITTYTHSETDWASGWGFHIGGDVSVFFNRVAGIGAFVRLSRGTVRDLPDYAGPSDVTTGGVDAGGGLRLKF